MLGSSDSNHTDKMSKAPFLDDRPSVTSGTYGYDLLVASEQRSRHHQQKSLQQTATRFAICILTAIVVFETIILSRTFDMQRHDGPVPQFSMREVVFQSSDEWEFSPVAEDLWATLIDDSGMVAIPDWQQYGLKEGLETAVPGSNVYGMVFTHEYHCMRMIRTALVGLMTRDEAAMSELYVANTSVELPTGKLAHLYHCVDYIRQNILCRADTTLEWRSDNNPKQVDGYGPPHQCRDWNEVRGWMNDHHPIDPIYQAAHHGHGH